ncbi:Protein kinase domain [Rubrobacter radiotolerans]|uniref:non-specific serine/threonine protein kinase n=1 Tax=Rubrobacter radiotolerans TaxID=42256 RepID=A0A023WYK9_RUBRA|nr:serine/threonine-protein kinase [Rubrobacter radiotolerans]AHY45312.1 Protein kinase domain [Rubrobacter radiotolerans]MDX5892724.1 serine/threonine-protein kinase [Rubrobacter radiotolerans]
MTETRYIEGQNRYALSEVVGRGGFATVWRARPVERSFFGASDDVAIKVISVYNEGERSRALREGQIAEGLRHPNIVETIEVIPGEREVYLVTEFVSGLPLDEAGRYYDCAEISDALAQILEALVYAHSQGVIHRDIKPQNALVDRNGTVKLTDFGVAYRAGDTRLTRIGFAVGTPGYIAPEIMDGSDPSALTDIYAVGATARTLLSHQPEEPPPRLRQFVDLATSPNPAHRPQSAWAALKVLSGKKAATRAARNSQERSPARTEALQRERTAPARSYTPRDDLAERGPAAPPERISQRTAGVVLRGINGLAAGYLGYALASGVLLLDGAQSVGVAVGAGVAGYLLPRLAALAVVVALSVALLTNGVGTGLALAAPAVAAVWIAASRLSPRGAGRAPLAPLLAAPLAVVNLAAGLPLLFGMLMRPVAAGVTATLAGAVLVLNDILRGDGVLPYYGGSAFREIPESYNVNELLVHLERIVTLYPEVLALPVLWGLMAALVSLGEWVARPLWGVVGAVGGGLIGYALFVSSDSASLLQAVTSLALASIMYAALRYLLARAG